MPTTFYIDGYNVIYRSKTLRPLAEEDFTRARETLIDRVAEICTALGRRAVLVFDGRSRHLPEHAEHGRGTSNLEVVYAPANKTADAVIERYVYQSSNKLDIVVVSGDRGLRDLCRNMGTLVIDADNFLATSKEIDRDVKALAARTRVTPPSFLEESLDANSLATLAALKDQLKKKKST